MNEKEKARELVAHYNHYVGDMKFGRCRPCQSVGMRHCAHADSCGSAEDVRTDKQCAVIAVDEICKALFAAGCRESYSPTMQFYQEVKTEIENL